MKSDPSRSGGTLPRATTTAACLAFLAIGSGCVSWEPIFRGSIGLTRWLIGP